MDASSMASVKGATIQPEIGPARNRLPSNGRFSVLVLIAFWAAIYLAGISSPALLDDVDALHAEAGREIVQRHDWVTIYTDGIRYMEKAPLMYWAEAVSYKLFGVADWSARLPLMLGVLALVVATYLLGRHVYGETGGLFSGLALATSLGVYIYTRFLIPEVLIALWLTLGYYFFLRSLEQEQPSRFVCWGFAATCAMNVLTKGLIGLLFPAGAIGIFLLVTRNFRHILKLRLVSSTLVFLAIAAPWHILAAIRNPAQGQAPSFLWLYFVNEHIMRFLNKRVPAGYDTVPLAIFWGLTLAWLLPWVAFLPQSSREFPAWWRTIRNPGATLNRRQRANLLFFLWAFVILGFFSFSTRQEYYTIPGVPGMALLVGGWLARESSKEATESDRRAGRISSLALVIFGVLGFAAGITLFSLSHPPAPGADLADLLKKNPDEYNLSLGHVLDLTPQALGAFSGPLLGVSFGLLLGTALNWALRRRGRPFAGNMMLAAMMVVLLACVHSAFVRFSPILSSYELAKAIQKQFRPGDVIVVDGEYYLASSVNFYTRVQLHVLHEPSGNLWYGAKFPDAPHIFETRQSLAALWNGPERVFLWTDQERPNELQGMPSFQLARSGGKYIFTNRDLRN
ncbi:MAG TPA: glycosyltransferase family 39 protein [Bryobacteraceae bacterium]|nr:glycosyltransferase family 39 protein [Bryobacteraceae bacterium]